MTSMNTVNHGGTKVYTGMTQQFDEAKSLQSQIQDARDDILNNPDLTDAQRDAALTKLDKAMEAVSNALDATTLSGQYDTNSGSTLGDGDMAYSVSQNQRASDLLDAAISSVAVSSQPVGPPPSAGGTSGVGGTGSASGTSGASQADPANDPAKTDTAGAASTQGNDAIVAAMLKDPANAYSQIEHITDPKQRAAIMQQMQIQLQAMNQMFSMLSNFAKVAHDTSKAMINNMRV